MSNKVLISILPDDESVSMATEDKAKDNESIVTDSVATESTTEASKVSLRFLKSLVIPLYTAVTLYLIIGHCLWCKFSLYYIWPKNPRTKFRLVLISNASSICDCSGNPRHLEFYVKIELDTSLIRHCYAHYMYNISIYYEGIGNQLNGLQ